MDIVANPPHILHALFKLSPADLEVLITGVHAPSAAKDKIMLWNNLGENPPPSNTPWLLMGDMNEVVNQSEKMGGRPVTNSQGRDFSKMTDREGLIDMRYNGPTFTWNNGREGTELIRERLDRALANAEWLKVYPQTQISQPRTVNFAPREIVNNDDLEFLASEKVGEGNWDPIKIGHDVSISHLFYADDVFLFAKASVGNVNAIMEVLLEFGNKSGLFISPTKSKVIFPPKMCLSLKRAILSFSNIKGAPSFGKYLGVNISPNRLKIADYVDLLNKTKSRIKGWQAKLLNMASRCTLIKSVLNSYPLYVMQTTLLPNAVLEELERSCRRFLWNKVDKAHYLPRTSWDKVCLPLGLGGLGMRNLKNWNLVFMDKLGWRIIKEPDKLWVKILHARYFKRSTFLNCIPNSSDSPLWRDILKGKELLMKGITYRTGMERTFVFGFIIG
ncbi:uncharacterized protein LOC110734956 [Chenopodium quinoa]|uniref:uncharacterized protein LOC110734956 n=1 Tax=Chenopodium quinoa TaxID=63459 RepID=UPI000B76CB0B|nr:uncharacterized protein LOC110734956 [Chenopodium quinoa]